MIASYRISRFDLIMCLSETVDMVSPALSGHHKQVAYLATRIAEAHGLSREAQKACLVAGAVHDLGGMTTKDRLDVFRFEDSGLEGHAQLGGRLLAGCSLLADVGPIVTHHHAAWSRRAEQGHPPLEAHVVHLADRIAVLVDRSRDILSQVPGILARIRSEAGRLFAPELVESFEAQAGVESLWLDLGSPTLGGELRRLLGPEAVELDLQGVLDLAGFFARLIDFRSHFTASHSQGVASVAELLARYAGFSPREQRLMRAAGLLHDLGKLAVPAELLEKPGRLTEAEFNLMRAHTYSTWRALRPVRDFELIAQWAAYHHERLDGSGYPFHIGGVDLSMGSRIMAVADVFVALTEDRPYREGMSTQQALDILRDMASQGALDPRLVALARGRKAELDLARLEAQEHAERSYRELLGP
jgi:HD-GYP domain-containing protein (c-di-GMP phosphodiesterase class II)